jgi:hypothetical protein
MICDLGIAYDIIPKNIEKESNDSGAHLLVPFALYIVFSFIM